jgi:serine phosphatase RsbU (regulator of sigma subunit)/pSer/pThr/pTyr-binding forkhead associated (FHA) protein
MPSLVTVIKGPNAGRRYPLDDRCTVIGRQPDAGIYLESLAVSRQHAQIICEDGVYSVQDTGSSNGTYVNGHRISGRVPLGERDTVQIGPYELTLTLETPPQPSDPPQVIRAKVDAALSNHTLFAQNPAQKLQVVLQIARDLGHTLDLDPLLGRLLEHLLRLFPQADRGMVLLCSGDHLVVRAQRTRLGGSADTDYPYSRTIVRRALEEGVGLLSEDVRGDRNLVLSATLVSLNLRSFLCVPLIGWEDRRLGVIQLDCVRASQSFRPEDLEMLTAVALQAAVVLQNAAYHAERLREERLRQEILLARDIQQQFLPSEFGAIGGTAELFASCLPAREVSGDLYDFFRLKDGRLAFFVGDVSGKGMPAALFMIAVRSLARHLAPSATGAGDFLQRLNTALANDNPTHLFVTMLFGIYDAHDGSVQLANGGHPPPLLRRADGTVEVVAVKPGLLLGSAPVAPRFVEARVELKPGETLVLYTDGYVEGTAPDGRTEFGVERLKEAVGGPRTALPLEACVAQASAAVHRFTGKEEQEDDWTMLLLRRK